MTKRIPRLRFVAYARNPRARLVAPEPRRTTSAISCFCGYASAQFSVVGAFEHDQTFSNDIVSAAAGELPCYLFLTNECGCACNLGASLVDRPHCIGGI